MSTRCSIHFTYGDETDANVYRHFDGCPDGEEGVLSSLQAFFAAVEEQAPDDTRFDDPPYLAARFVVWQAGRYALAGRPLAFVGVGVQIKDPGDIQFRFQVDCLERDERGRPSVTWEGL